MNWLSQVLLVAIATGSVRCKNKGFAPSSQTQYGKDTSLDRIVGGDLSPAGRYPYQVAIQTDFGLFCGGALISEYYIFTAAHCIDGIFYMIATLGVHNIRNKTNEWVELVLHRDSCLLHPQWDPATRANDIAIIELPEPVELNDIINVIGLPSRWEKQFDYSGKYVTVTGWGFDSNNGIALTPQLHYAQIRILPYEVCKHFYPERMSERQLCTDTGQGKSICDGDSGAPIVYRRGDGTSALIGMASFVSRLGCASGWPNVFTRIDAYLDWIESVTNLTIAS